MTMCVVLRCTNCNTDARLTTGVEHNVLSVVGALLKRVRIPLPPTHMHIHDYKKHCVSKIFKFENLHQIISLRHCRKQN